MICQEIGPDKSNSTNYVSGLDPPFSKVLYQGKGHRWALLGLKTVESKFQSFSNDICIIVLLNLFTRSAAKAAEGRAGSGGQRGNPDLTLLTASASNLPFLHSSLVSVSSWRSLYLFQRLRGAWTAAPESRSGAKNVAAITRCPYKSRCASNGKYL